MISLCPQSARSALPVWASHTITAYGGSWSTGSVPPPVARCLPSGLKHTLAATLTGLSRLRSALPVSRSHTFGVLSGCPEARRLPSGLKHTLRTLDLLARRTRGGSSLCMFQTFTSPPLPWTASDPGATRLPSGLKARQRRRLGWALKECIISPLSTSQTLTVPSVCPAASRRPSPRKLRPQISLTALGSSSRRVRASWLRAASQTLIVPEESAEARRL